VLNLASDEILNRPFGTSAQKVMASAVAAGTIGDNQHPARLRSSQSGNADKRTREFPGLGTLLTRGHAWTPPTSSIGCTLDC
jgi:hypothetical protein